MHFYQKPNTAFTIESSFKLEIEINKDSLQGILNSVQLPDVALQNLDSARQTVSMLLSTEYGLSAFHPIIKSLVGQVLDVHSKIQSQAIIFYQIAGLTDNIEKLCFLLSQVQGPYTGPSGAETVIAIESALRSLTVGIEVILFYHWIDAKDLCQDIDKIKNCNKLSQAFSELQQQIKVLRQLIEAQLLKRDGISSPIL
ncbi:hypothetical protein BDN72DRAFT_879008 [Pluteus cervinus]|uniref:Uncharacterized protein n=1 Tax=Pluteus cervinus TaxID=181527 RepID=A0ACD3ASJ3_9AGAR|nr:hypothetical protein BDN72DRAFT_879008 [Pluteus cervinus]